MVTDNGWDTILKHPPAFLFIEEKLWESLTMYQLEGSQSCNCNSTISLRNTISPASSANHSNKVKKRQYLELNSLQFCFICIAQLTIDIVKISFTENFYDHKTRFVSCLKLNPCPGRS